MVTELLLALVSSISFAKSASSLEDVKTYVDLSGEIVAEASESGGILLCDGAESEAVS